MPLNFPNSPTANQIYTDSTTGNRYLWDATKNVWRWSPNTISLVVSSTAPGSPSPGQLWWNSDYGRMFVYYNDGDSSQWVETNPIPDIATVAYPFANNTANSANSFAVTVGAASNTWANTKLSNSTGTLAGSLTVTGDLIATSISAFGQGFANANLITQIGSSTWTVPTGVERFKVTLVGAGGAGGGTSTPAGQTGNGGGSGSVCIGFFNYVVGVDTLYCNVGIGAAASSANGLGANGSSSNVSYNDVYMYANGGFGGQNNSVVNAGGAGGSASGGTINLSGDNGHSGGVAAATNPVAGEGGTTPLGWGTGGNYNGTAAGGAGIRGDGYGSGGSGAKNGTGSTTARGGGAGANGAILIEW